VTTLAGFRAAAIALFVALVVLGFLYYQLSREREAIEKLRVEVAGASITRLGLTSCDVAIRFKYTNPSDHDTPTFWVSSYSVYLNGELVGTGSMPPTKVVARSSVYQDLTVTVEYSRVTRALVDAILKGKFQVEVRGEVRARILLGLLEVSAPFTSTYSIG